MKKKSAKIQVDMINNKFEILFPEHLTYTHRMMLDHILKQYGPTRISFLINVNMMFMETIYLLKFWTFITVLQKDKFIDFEIFIVGQHNKYS